MDENIKRLVEKYSGKDAYGKLALTTEQEQAVVELEAAIKKCCDAQVGFVQSDYGCYAYNEEDVYDMDCNYDDYSVCDVDLSRLRKVEMSVHEMWNGKNETGVSFYSTVFPEPTVGETNL
jgi:hypothetical protein